MELGKRFKSIALLMHEVFQTIDGAQFGSSKAHYFSQLKGCGELGSYLFGKPQNTTQRIFSAWSPKKHINCQTLTLTD